MAALSSALCYFTYSFMEPILAKRLTDFELTSLQIGLFFAIWPVFYIPASVMVQYMPRWVDRRVTIILSAFFSGVAFIFVGPSEMFSMPDSLVLMGIGQALVGIFTAFMMIPGLPEMVESMIPLYPGQERAVNDLSAGLYNAFLGFGQVVAPGYGAFMTEAVGFRWTSDVVAIICFFFALVYFIIAGGVPAFRDTFKKKSSVDEKSHVQALFGDSGEISDDGSKSRSSSFHMIGPTSPAVNKMRLERTISDYSPTFAKELHDDSIANMKNNRVKRTTRINSDIGGAFGGPASEFSSFERGKPRAASFMAED